MQSFDAFPTAAFYIRPIGEDGPHHFHMNLRGLLTLEGPSWGFEGTAERWKCFEAHQGSSDCRIEYNHDQWLDIEFIDQNVRIPSTAWKTNGQIELKTGSGILGFSLNSSIDMPNHRRRILSPSSFEIRLRA